MEQAVRFRGVTDWQAGRARGIVISLAHGFWGT
jgi:hypothetical protein